MQLHGNCVCLFAVVFNVYALENGLVSKWLLSRHEDLSLEPQTKVQGYTLVILALGNRDRRILEGADPPV